MGITESDKNNRNEQQRRKNFRKRPRWHNRQIEYKSCPICGKSVKSMLTAIAVNEEGDPAHFDCVLKQLTEQEKPVSGEKITYIGNGTFAVVKMKPGSRGASFTVIKRIQYENKDLKADWRKRISKRIKK